MNTLDSYMQNAVFKMNFRCMWCFVDTFLQGCLCLSDVVEVYTEMWGRKGKSSAKQAQQRKKLLEDQVSNVH